ncbi:methyltransferase 1 [Seminavis robusta]|uniref:DNA (cytosine-5-)-methyltransferase n=1 Tax=Seminavis robusta TaxID=568900 RepID=A0A9N8E7W7_9STRA|nr:methyltransferase 1 [Seminavis robusta]|eukprot:Sro779_g201270.1 methyltransferase 1 (437) ;mRNA; r:19736-21046
MEISQASAICKVFVALQHTTIKEATNTVLFNERFGYRYKWKYAELPEKAEFPLKELLSAKNTGISHDDIRTNLVWEPHIKGSDGEWKAFSYKLKNQTGKKFVSHRTPIGMDLFAGAGGTALGFQEAGLDIRWSVEMDRRAAETLRHNSNDTKHVIVEEDAKIVLKSMREGKKKDELPAPEGLDTLHASPNCQDYSLANPFRGRKVGDSNNTTRLSTEYAEYVLPKVFTFENVMGIVQGESRHLFQEVVAKLLALGYQVRGSVLNAMDYGDPQSRKRVILIAVQDGCELPKAPEPTHGEGTGRAHVTTLEAIGDLETLDPEPVNPTDPDVSCSNLMHTVVGHQFRRDLKAFVVDHRQQVLQSHKPAPTILCGKAVGHYNLDREATPREKARLQGFPDNYVFKGSYLEQIKQIGNAVPVGMATAIGRTVMSCFLITTK